MDRKTRDHFQGISAKNWKDLGYDETPQRCNLSDKINPVFANYHKKDRGFVGTDEDYAMIMPALRLASKYLYSPKSCRFLYSIVYGDRKTVSGRVLRCGLTVKILGRLGVKLIPGACTEISRIDEHLYCPKKMEHIWNKLAKYNHFSAKENEEDNDGETRLELEDGADLRNNGRRGHATSIIFNTRFLEDIRRLKRKGLNNSHEMLSMQFRLANVLCHEVAHAVVMASDTTFRQQIVDGQKYIVPFIFVRVPPEPFFEGQKMAEMGYAWEKEVIGGKLMGPASNIPNEFLSITDWPNGDPCSHAAERGVHHKSTVKAYIVDMKYIQSAFREEFWDDWAKMSTKHRGQALKIPKTLGWEYERRSMEKSGHSSKKG